MSVVALLAVANSTSRAQQLDCSEAVKKALQQTTDKCSALARNKACYGYGVITALPADSVTDFQFGAPGDTVPVTAIKSLQLTSLDAKGVNWGVAYFRIQANLPDTTAGQYVTMLMFGDAQYQNQTQQVSNSATAKQTINAVYFGTGPGSPVCHNAPTSGLLIQAPQGAKTVNLTVDGVQLGVNSTVFIQAPLPKLNRTAATKAVAVTQTPTASPAQKPKLVITTIQGHVSVTSNGQTKTITNNQSVSVDLNDDGDTPVGDPVEEAPPDDMQALIEIDTQSGSDGLFLTTPDLNATEVFSGDGSPDANATQPTSADGSPGQNTPEPAPTDSGSLE